MYIEHQDTSNLQADSDVKTSGGGDAEKPPDGLWPLLILSLVYLHCNACGFVVPALLPQARSHTPYHSHVTVRRLSTQRPVTASREGQWACRGTRGRRPTRLVLMGNPRRTAQGWRRKPQTTCHGWHTLSKRAGHAAPPLPHACSAQRVE